MQVQVIKYGVEASLETLNSGMGGGWKSNVLNQYSCQVPVIQGLPGTCPGTYFCMKVSFHCCKSWGNFNIFAELPSILLLDLSASGFHCANKVLSLSLWCSLSEHALSLVLHLSFPVMFTENLPKDFGCQQVYNPPIFIYFICFIQVCSFCCKGSLFQHIGNKGCSLTTICSSVLSQSYC